MEYKSKLDDYHTRKRTYNDNMHKAYALIQERYAKALQNKLLGRTDYEAQIYNEPIQLLQAIKEHSLNYQDTRYEMSIITDAFCAMFNLKQQNNESLQDYT